MRYFRRALLLFAVAGCSLFQSHPVSAQELTRYVYDARGRLVRVETPTANSQYAYDDAENRNEVRQRLLFPTAWMAKDLPHGLGYAEGGGWAANVTQGTGHMTYGPYTQIAAAGTYTATWRAMVDVANAANDDIVTIEVYDATAGQFLAQATITRHRFAADFVYQVFELPFEISAARTGHAIELRTFYHSRSYTRIEKIGYYAESTPASTGPGPSIAIGNASVSEGGTAAFVVSLSTAQATSVSVNYATAYGSAGSADIIAKSGTLTFSPGQTSQTITVSTRQDTIKEASETFTVNLSNPTGGAVIAGGQGTGTIFDDDDEPMCGAYLC